MPKLSQYSEKHNIILLVNYLIYFLHSSHLFKWWICMGVYSRNTSLYFAVSIHCGNFPAFSLESLCFIRRRCITYSKIIFTLLKWINYNNTLVSIAKNIRILINFFSVYFQQNKCIVVLIVYASSSSLDTYLANLNFHVKWTAMWIKSSAYKFIIWIM